MTTTRLLDRTKALFGSVPGVDLRLFFSPGRANLLGAHLDYNGGSVVPVALSRGTYGAFGLRHDGLLRMRSAQFPGAEVEVPLAELRPGRTTGWSAYLEGAIHAASQAWGRLPGLEIAVCADLPMARGLSSSASVETLAVYAVAQLMQRQAGADEMVRLAHQAENEYVGVRCGILDQAAILHARADSALYFDCLNFTREHLPLAAREALVAIMDTGVQRELAGSAFNQRVAECTRALAVLQEERPGLTCLRDARREDFERLADRLPPVLQRRVRHVIGEVERTETGAEALRRGDLAGFGAAMSGAHESLRENYEVSTPELDAMVAAAQSVAGCFGARLTGAGFGGCAVALVHPAAREEFGARVPAAYLAATGRDTAVQWYSPAGGPRECADS